MIDRSFLTRPSRRAMLGAATLAGVDLALGDLAGAGVCAALAAGSPAGYPDPNPALAGERANLSVWLTPELAAAPAYQHAINLFHRQYPTIRVSVTPVPKDDIPVRLKIAAGGGSGVAPDLISHHGYIFGAQGLAHESDALWSAWGAQDSFLPSAMQDVQWRLDKFGVPLVSNPILTVLNAQMFHKAGISLPTQTTSFSAFTGAVKAVKRASGSRYAMITLADGATATAVAHANGGALFKTVKGRNIATVNDPRVVTAIRFYTELSWKLKLAPLPPTGPTNRAYIAQLFAARQAPAFFGTIADLGLIQSIDPSLQVALAPLPGGVTGHTTGSVNDGASMVVTAATRKPHAAFELAKWLVARPPALALAESLRLAPTVKDYYRDSFFRRDPSTATYFTVAQTATPIGLDAYTEAYSLYKDALRAAFAGGDPARLLSGIQGRCQEAMDKADAGIDADQ